MKRENKELKKKESGQIIVLLALSLVVVMVVAALAVDGGMIYSERRFAQNAADASSLAGGGYVLNYMEKLNDQDKKTITSTNLICNSSLVTDLIDKTKERTILVANANNIDLPYLGKILDGTPYPNDLDMDFKHGFIIECVSGKQIDVKVRVTSTISTAFAHLIFPGDLETTNEAVSRAKPYSNIGNGNGIVSLSEDCWTTDKETGGMEFDGLSNGKVVVKKGGIHSNSCFMISGSNVPDSIKADTITSIDEAQGNHTEYLDYTYPVNLLEIDDPEPPVCGDIQNMDKKDTSYEPGTYVGGITITGDATFASGIYCLQGDLSISGNGTIQGTDVMFYITKNGSNVSTVSISGNPNVLLSAIKTPTEENDHLYGMLIYMDRENVIYNNDGTIKTYGSINITGESGSYFAGTIYAPTATITAGGNPDLNDPNVCKFVTGTTICQATTFTTQFIGYDVKIHGSAQFEILYDESIFAHKDGTFYLLK